MNILKETWGRDFLFRTSDSDNEVVIPVIHLAVDLSLTKSASPLYPIAVRLRGVFFFS